MLDDLFATARNTPVKVSEDLTAKLLSEALAVQQPSKQAFDTRQRPHRVRTLFLELFGGWPAVAGYVTASLIGVWIGLTPQIGQAVNAQSYFSGTDHYSVDLEPDAAFDVAGGYY